MAIYELFAFIKSKEWEMESVDSNVTRSISFHTAIQYNGHANLNDPWNTFYFLLWLYEAVYHSRIPILKVKQTIIKKIGIWTRFFLSNELWKVYHKSLRFDSPINIFILFWKKKLNCQSWGSNLWLLSKSKIKGLI